MSKCKYVNKKLFIIIQYKLLPWEYEKLLPFLYVGQSFYYNPDPIVNLTLIIFPKKDSNIKQCWMNYYYAKFMSSNILGFTEALFAHWVVKELWHGHL